MAVKYRTSGTSAMKPEWDGDNIVPFSKDPQEDYSGYEDHSNPPDYSNTGGKVIPFPNNSDNSRNEQNKNTKESLLDAERSAAGSGKKSRDLGEQEHTGGWTSDTKASSPLSAGKGKKNNLASKAKTKVTVAVVSAVVAAIGALGGIFLPGIIGTTGIVQFSEMLNGLSANLESINAKRMNKMFMKQVNEDSRTPGTKGLCTKNVKVACRYSGMSNRAIRNLERRTGIKVIAKDSFHLPGRSGVAELELPNGERLSAAQFYDRMNAGDANLQRMMRQAMKPRVAIWASAKVQSLFKKLKIDKARQIR